MRTFKVTVVNALGTERTIEVEAFTKEEARREAEENGRYQVVALEEV